MRNLRLCCAMLSILRSPRRDSLLQRFNFADLNGSAIMKAVCVLDMKRFFRSLYRVCDRKWGSDLTDTQKNCRCHQSYHGSLFFSQATFSRVDLDLARELLLELDCLCGAPSERRPSQEPLWLEIFKRMTRGFQSPQQDILWYLSAQLSPKV